MESEKTQLSLFFKNGISHFPLLIFIMQLAAWKKLFAQGFIGSELSFEAFYQSNISWEKLRGVFAQLGNDWPAFRTVVGEAEFETLSSKELAILLHEAQELGEIDYYGLINYIDRTDRLTYATPVELCELFAAFERQEKYDSIYNPFSKSYDLALYLARSTGRQVFTEEGYQSSSSNTSRFHGPEFFERVIVNPIPYLLNHVYDTHIEPEFTDPLFDPTYKETDHILHKFDMVVSTSRFGKNHSDNARFSNDPFNRFHFADNDLEVASIEHIMAQTKRRAFVLVTTGFLFRVVAKEKMFKNYLVEEGLIEAIISLPQNLLPAASISTGILVLNPQERHESILFINASSFYERNTRTRKNILVDTDRIASIFHNREEVDLVSCFVSRDTLASKDFNLLPDLYVSSEEEQKVEAFLANIPMRPLSEVATLIRPQNIPPTTEDDCKVFLEVITGDLPHGGFIDALNENKQKRVGSQYLGNARRYILEPFDILLSIKGSTGKVGIIGENPSENWIAGQVFLIIRFSRNRKEDAIALYMYLKSDAGQTTLKRLTVGVTIPSIQAKSLSDLRVPVFSSSQKQKVIENFNKEVQLYREIHLRQKEIALIHDNFLS